MGERPVGHGLVDVADAGAFLARLLRFDRAALVRLRPGAAGRVELWGRLPWGVLVSRGVDGSGHADVTVPAAGLLAELESGGSALPALRDGDWRWPLPGPGARTVETVPAAELRRIATAAEAALRAATTEGVGGRAVGQRALRDALLDHVAIVVAPSGAAPRRDVEPDAAVAGAAAGGTARAVEVPQRLVQAVTRMGFVGSATATADASVHVRLIGRWVGLSAPYGSAWWLDAGPLTLMPRSSHPFG
ncbi:hypothetical protein [Plantactinospora sp. GCM10030261]|uniref:hypothetical protein n=1 Tax=Plantactinospora sp. GCM10030261 TaxID=3273420 RepID=UPI00360F545D